MDPNQYWDLADPQIPEVSTFLNDSTAPSHVPLDLDVDYLGPAPQQTAILSALPRPVIHPILDTQPTLGVLDGGNTRYSAASVVPAGSNPVVFNNLNGEPESLFGHPGLPIPMTSGLVPASLLSPIQANPASLTFGPHTGASEPIVQTWDASAFTFAAPIRHATDTASANTGGPRRREVPIFHCACTRHGRPLVRVHDVVEWVSPDVMKMVTYFNFSPNAGAEAHSFWDPCGA
jgi:hypothetical protein